MNTRLTFRRRSSRGRVDCGFPATVRRINPMVDSSSRTFQVETEVPNDEGMLRPGGFAKASIVVKGRPGARRLDEVRRLLATIRA